MLDAGSQANLRWTDDGRVAVLSFVSESRVNAIDQAMVENLRACLDELNRVSTCRVMVLRGTDAMFSGGADLDMFLELDEPTYIRFVTAEYEFCRLIESLPCVTVAAITGPCLGYGFELALSCDFRVARSQAKVGFPETRIGFMSPAQRLSRYVGIEVARRLTYEGSILQAEEAEALGLISRCTEDENFELELDTFVMRYARMAPLALRATKRNLDLAYGVVTNHDLQEIAAATRTFVSADLREGIAATLGKRIAEFEGE